MTLEVVILFGIYLVRHLGHFGSAVLLGVVVRSASTGDTLKKFFLKMFMNRR